MVIKRIKYRYVTDLILQSFLQWFYVDAPVIKQPLLSLSECHGHQVNQWFTVGAVLPKPESNCQFSAEPLKIAILWLWNTTNSCKCGLVAEHLKFSQLTLSRWPLELWIWVINDSWLGPLQVQKGTKQPVIKEYLYIMLHLKTQEILTLWCLSGSQLMKLLQI